MCTEGARHVLRGPQRVSSCMHRSPWGRPQPDLRISPGRKSCVCAACLHLDTQQCEFFPGNIFNVWIWPPWGSGLPGPESASGVALSGRHLLDAAKGQTFHSRASKIRISLRSTHTNTLPKRINVALFTRLSRHGKLLSCLSAHAEFFAFRQNPQQVPSFCGAHT